MLHPQPELQAATAGEEEEDAAASAADAQMQGVNRAFATAKRAGVPAATRLMKELRRVCMNGSYEVSVNEDAPQPLLCWAVRLYEFNFDEDSALAEDLAELSSRSGRDEHHSLLLSGHVLDGALCMEMLVEWQPQYGNIEAMLVQICAFIGPSARVASLVPPAAEAAVAGASPGPSTPATAVEQETAAAAYEVLRGIHEKKGWAPPDKHG